MHLRDHPLMRHRGVRNWPPVWTKARREDRKTVRGEVGILRYVQSMTPSDKCYLVIEHEMQYLVGTLIFDDVTFCRQIGNLLREHVGRSITEIGDLDTSSTL